VTAIKPTSTNQVNKRENDTKCPVTFTLNKIGGRWKPLIINRLLSGPKRYGELKREIPAITEKMLIQHLKELEADKLINRVAQAVVPPHVEYSLTDVGRDLSPVLVAMKDWATKYNV
jgi:DNA-binding HxlR family transcriptional regulator